MSYYFGGGGSSNTVKFDLFNVSATANQNLVTTGNDGPPGQPYGYGYLTPVFQNGAIFAIYICISAAASLKIIRFQTSSGNSISGEVFAAEVAGVPNWHSIEVSEFEQINLQISSACTVYKLTVLETV